MANMRIEALMARTDPRPHYGENRPRIGANGYIYVYAPSHPTAMADGYALEHRKFAFDLGLLVDLSDHVHHRNHDPRDNHLQNLEVLSASEHSAHHGLINRNDSPDCIHGHRGEVVRGAKGNRYCRACLRERMAARKQRAA